MSPGEVIVTPLARPAIELFALEMSTPRVQPPQVLITPASRADHVSGGRSDAALRARLRLISRNATFWLLFFGFVLCGFTTSGVIEVHLIPYAMSHAYPRIESAAALGV